VTTQEQPIRTWTLVMSPSGCDGEDFHVQAVGPDVGWTEAEQPRAIELGPVLDLLEGFVTATNLQDYQAGEAATKALLKAHGRKP